jgi:C4-dicarboxylate transporter DctM subunit
VTIFACMLFGAAVRLPTATCAAIGSIMVPSMIEAGYSKRFSLGTDCGGRNSGLYYSTLNRE